MQRSKLEKSTKRNFEDESTASSTDLSLPSKLEKFTCEYCSKNITYEVHIQCSICTDVFLCIDCFSVGCELNPHKNYHDFYVKDVMTLVLFDLSWSAHEERLLLEGLETFGYGNWVDISEFIGTKTPEAVEHHYVEIYLSKPQNLPNTKVIYDTRKTLLMRRSNTTPLIQSNMGIVTLQRRAEQSFSDLAGYMPLRGDFEFEYDMDAELFVRDIVFNDDDTPLDIELKVAMLMIYNEKLDERERRKRFCEAHGVMDSRKQAILDKKYSKEEREIREKCKPFARFYPSAEKFDIFVEGLIREARLRSRIKQLQEYRQNGITTLEAGAFYDEEKKKRDENERQLKKLRDYSSLSYLSDRHLLSSYRRNFTKESALNSADSSVQDSSDSKSHANHGKTLAGNPNLPKNAYIPPKRKGLASSHSSAPLDITQSCGIELLSEEEKKICSSVRILPQQYLNIKNILIKEYVRLGHLKLGQARPLIRIDVNKTRKIFDFLVQQRWINKE